jgi:hypothetical protein
MSEFESFTKLPEECCSICMEDCINQNDCQDCLAKMSCVSPKIRKVPNRKMIKSLTDFLCTLDINDHLPVSSAPYSENSLATVILESLDKFNVCSDIEDYLTFFSLAPDIIKRVSKFIMSDLSDSPLEDNICDEDFSDESEQTSEDNRDTNESSEYFDSEDSEVY